MHAMLILNARYKQLDYHTLNSLFHLYILLLHFVSRLCHLIFWVDAAIKFKICE